MLRTYSERNPERGQINRYLWLLLLLGLLSSFAAAAEPAGRLLFAKGSVQVLREGEAPRMVTRGDVIEVGDTIQTGEKARAQLRLNDGAMVALRSDTVYRIDTQNYDRANPQNSSQATKLLRGGLRAITGAIGKENPSGVKLSTPVATIGIRGTVYETIYVPPGGLPGMPDVPPGHYTLVLQGSVDLSNPAGALTLAVGEIGYVADANTPPELRPDLSWLFARYATFEEDEGGNGGDGTDGDAGGDTEPNTSDIDNVLTETASPQTGVAPGPLALIAARDSDGIAGYLGSFVSSTVTVGPGGELELASGGYGDISFFDSNGASPLSTPGSVVAGDSTIYWGSYNSADVTLGPTDLSTGSVAFIDATQILVTLNDLPTTGSYSYTMVGNTSGLTSGSLTVDFGTAKMDVSLDATGINNGIWSASNQDISSFYGNGISLSDGSTGSGTLVGRFVGSNAEGAMAAYRLDGIVLDTGTAAFTR